MTPSEVRRASRRDRGRAATALADAFADDPVLSFLLPPAIPARRRRLPAFFALEVPRSRRHGGAWTTTDGTAAALHPPGRWREPLWLAVAQGTGRGSALLTAVLNGCDAEGHPAYLEATSERNRALYRRHGFRDLDPLPLPAGGPPLYPMWRDAR